jgi:hypothetical protein
LRFTVQRQRYRFVKLEYRAAVQSDEILALEFEGEGEDGSPFGPGPASPQRRTLLIFEFLTIDR